MLAHEERVITEKNELTKKLVKLITFIGSDRFNDVHFSERSRLSRQPDIMKSYLDILNERIATF